MRSPLVLLLPLLTACFEIEIDFPDETGGGGPGSDDTGPTGDTDSDEPDDSADPGEHLGTWSWGAEVTVDMAGASFVGEVADDNAGGCLLAPGDRDGDGIGDLLIGAPDSEELSENGGKVYFVNGRTSGWSLEESLAPYPAYAGHDSYQLCQMSALGDVNGDGLADVALSTGYTNPAPPDGQFLVLGSETSWTGTRSTEDADAVLYDSAFDGSTGLDSRMAVGDMDGDGLDDWLLRGSVHYNGEAHLISGADASGELWTPDDSSMWIRAEDALYTDAPYGETPYVYFYAAGDLNGDGLADLFAREYMGDNYHLIAGSADGLPTDVRVEDAAATTILPPDGAELDGYGFIGDVNGDGIRDLSVQVSDPLAGGTTTGDFFFFGQTTFRAELEVEDADVHVCCEGVGSAKPLGDINGDGLADIGLIGPTPEDPMVKALFLFFGRTEWPEDLDVLDADVRITPGTTLSVQWMPEPHERGDVNGDGLTDFVLRQPNATIDGVAYAGAMDLILGRTDWPEELSLDESDARFVGSADATGVGNVVVLGDLNGDGFDDVVSSSWGDGDGEEDLDRSRISVFFGQPSP